MAPDDIVKLFFCSPEFQDAWSRLRKGCAHPDGWLLLYHSKDGVTVNCCSQIVQREFSLFSKEEADIPVNGGRSPWELARLWVEVELAQPFFHNYDRPGGAIDLFLRREIPEAALWFETRWKYDTELRSIGAIFQERFAESCRQDEVVNSFIEELKGILSDEGHKRKAEEEAAQDGRNHLATGIHKLAELGWDVGKILAEVRSHFEEDSEG